MRNFIKAFFIVLCTIIFIIFIMISLIMIVFQEPHSAEMMEKEFTQNEEDIIEIAEFRLYLNILI